MRNCFFTIFRYKDKTSQDKLGKFPQDVHIPSFPERRFLWTSRVLVGFSVFSISFTMALASAIYLILPQISSYPYLYKHQQNTSSLSPVLPGSTAISAEKLMTERIIRRYIFLRHTFSKELAKTLNKCGENSELHQLSNDELHKSFCDKMNISQTSELILMEFVRNVEIEYVLQLNKDFWLADFTTYTSTKKYPEPIKAYWRAHIRIKQDKLNDDIEKLMYNPLGFKIVQYSVAYSGGDNEKQSYLAQAKKGTDTKQSPIQ